MRGVLVVEVGPSPDELALQGGARKAVHARGHQVNANASFRTTVCCDATGRGLYLQKKTQPERKPLRGRVDLSSDIDLSVSR